MKYFVLDTNIWIELLKDRLADDVNRLIGASDNVLLMPVAVKAELLSIAQQSKWGERKIGQLKELLAKAPIIDTNEEILNAYVEVDVYSQGKSKDKILGMSPRNMGKNDIWIAATALAANATLVTGDNDFDHLRGSFLTVVKHTPAPKAKDTPTPKPRKQP
jgi:tRNA(fMet)-specific endonuclease VapC